MLPARSSCPRTVLADIFLGKIKTWNDPAIAKLNPKVKLPADAITVVHRADGSGTTFIFTNYLSKVSQEWKEKVGNDKSVSWPTGVGAKGNEGVANNVKQVQGGIGYVEYAYAIINKIPYANLINKAGKVVTPSMDSFKAAAAARRTGKMPPVITWCSPISPGIRPGPSPALRLSWSKKSNRIAEKAKAMLKFFDWCYKHGDNIAEELHYVPLPDSVVAMIQDTWS